MNAPESQRKGIEPGPVIVCHGGVGQIPEQELPIRLRSVAEAAQAGHELLSSRGSALDAAVRAVVSMEDAPLLNAGFDCCLNLDGEAEHDASVMDSSGLCAGIGAVQGVRNPILLARAVAERTDHRLLVARGAERLARLLGLEMAGSVTPRAEQRYGELIGRLQHIGNYATEAGEGFAWKKLPELLGLYGIARGLVAPLALPPPEPDQTLHSTVGAVALDLEGRLAAATSTGGIWLKLPGRVGDSAVVGAGTYCDERGAASATGAGDSILKVGLCRKAVELLGKPGYDPQRAAREIIELASGAKIDCGLILLGADGRWAAEHNCRHMPRVAAVGPEFELLSLT
jgi:L-asparaginase / beta-aspartyl-peptidase